MKNATTSASLVINAVRKGADLTQVQVTVDGVPLEYASHQGGPWEVYDYPKRWRGVPRFLGHLPAETGIKLDGVLARRELRS